MAIIMGQANVPAGSTIATLFAVPPSYCNVTFYNVGANTVWIGTSTAVTTSNGMQCHSIPTSLNGYMGSKGATFYGLNTAATTAQVQYIIATDQ